MVHSLLDQLGGQRILLSEARTRLPIICSSVMLWALLLGGFAVVLIDVVPDYVALGVAASVAVALLRILQGFSIGGEWEAADNYVS
ncbi:MAG: hypothetical protein ACO2PM_03155 [Pyrobaculum sp.]